MMLLELALAAVALGLALALRPWRLLRGRPALLTPLLATLVVLPWLWALPALHRIGRSDAPASSRHAMPCNPHSRLRPKKRVSSGSMPGSQRRLVWRSPTET